ncbi:MAG: leishmanolysin-related zinc metalloendopeptidase, partial [Gemmatimonadota bacterium]
GFQIHIRQSEGVTLSAGQQAAVSSAVTKLQAAITGDLGDIGSLTRAAGTCAGATTPALDESLDDVIIYLEFVPIDGPGGTVGSAGPCLVRTGTALSALGGMRFDTDDLAAIEALGLLPDIIVHEMMHVLGFGTFWESPIAYLVEPSDPANPEWVSGMTDTHFTGPAALAEFAAIGGGSYTGGNIVPVENDTGTFGPGSLDGHWRESVFGEELMTPAANLPSNPMSTLTIASFSDLGYTVSLAAADPYSKVFSIVLGPAAPRVTVDLSGDVWRGRIDAIDPDGTIRRVR